MELTSPPPCPTTVTVRRNPPRRARPTPYTTTQPQPPPKTPTPSSAIRSFPINDILSITIPNEASKPPIEQSDSEKLKVFLRIRPILVTNNNNNKKEVVKKNVWPKERKKDVIRKRKDEICLRVNDDHSVTLNPPASVAEVRRTKSEVYQGFSYVFAPEASQNEVYQKMVNPLVEDVLLGKSGMLAAMGPSGSGKTHTVFGSARDPGMVSLALRQIFSEKGSNGSKSWTFYLSMFEIYSERGKGERIMDLSPDGGDLSMQQSTIKGLQEVVIHDVQQAESFIASGMLKRSTAMTNSNLQSSRSQCIINIRCEIGDFDEDGSAQSSTAMLTIVDLAGAERERRTGNQGTRLVESNFINNTSMVFGLCLRSLLEHQKNRKKPLHKHFQNSLLTKYLRDFLQGKKRMALILTAKSGDEDYQDTSYLLRQAAPYMNIKFENVEEQPANTFGNKRRTQILSKTEQVKRMKLNSNGACTDDEVRRDILHQPNKELIPKKDEDAVFNGSSAECPVIIDAEADFDKSLSENATNLTKTARENQILLNFSRALWNVLKEYKSKLDANVDEISSLRHSLTAEKERCSVLETELNLMKASCSCGKEAVADVEENGSKAKLTDCMVELERYQPIDVLESNTKISSPHAAAILEISTDTVDEQVSCSNLCEEEHVDSGLVSGLNGTSFAEVVSTSLSVQNVEEHSNEKENVSVEYVLFDKEDLKGLADLDLSCEIADTVTDLVKAVSVSSVLVMSEEKSNEKFGDSSPKIVFGKQEFNEVQEREVDSEITDLAGLGSELSSVVGDEASSTLEEDKPEEEEKQVTRSVEVISISSEVEKCVDQSIEEINESSPNVVFDKREFSEVEDLEADGEITGCDTLDSAGLGSELPFVVDDEVSSILEEDILESTINAQVIGAAEVTSTSGEEEKFVEQSNKEIDEPSPIALLDEKEFTEVEEREANGERSGFDSLASAGRGSEFSPVVGDESSSTFEEDKPEKNEKEAPRSEVISVSNELELFEEQSNRKIDELSPNVVLVKQEVKEVEARVTDGERTGCDGSDTAARGSELPSVDAEEISNTLEEEKSVHEKEVNVVISSSNLEGSNCVGNKHLLDTEVPDQQLVLPGDVISSQKSNASKPCQSNPAKPKRRLRPASSVMLRNINILEFDDATEMPKQNHGKRGEKEDVGKKRTQGNISLLRLLKQNLHH